MEIGDSKDGAYTVIATPSLAQAKDHQKFVLKTPATGRYLRLTVLNNWGDAQYMEMMDVYAYGKPLVKRACRITPVRSLHRMGISTCSKPARL